MIVRGMEDEDGNRSRFAGLRLPKGERLADDFVQFFFGWAAAEGEGCGEVFPVVQRELVEITGDENFQRGAFFYVAGVFQELASGIGELLFLAGSKFRNWQFVKVK